MPAEVHITVRGIAELRRKLSPALYRAAVKDLLTDAALYAEREARLGVPKDTSALARSIVHEVGAMGARVHSPLVYASVMEYGRRPGARMPPPDALRGWAKRHGMAGLEFVLARAIARRGIKGRFFMRKAADGLRNHEMPRLIRLTLADIERRWGAK